MRTGRRIAEDDAHPSRWAWWGFDAPAAPIEPQSPLDAAPVPPAAPSIPIAGYVLLASSIVVAIAGHLPRFTATPPGLPAVDPMTFQAAAILAIAAIAFLAVRPLRSWRYAIAFACSLLTLALAVYDLGRLDGWARAHPDLWAVPSVGWWLVFLGSLCMTGASAWLLDPRHRTR
ncbi:MAG: hypothetical protein JNK12_23745 [Acidimicrobiales bacterium]|nr:hypothetical protein [Acidimicrobiales bacterium]